jgi:ligand-binding SRPBCC domain-containing protein
MGQILSFGKLRFLRVRKAGVDYALMNSKTEMSVQAVHSQLERMRAMQYQYHGKFFQWLVGSLVGFFVLWLWGGQAGALWIPFLIVTAGVQASFYLHFCDFARMHARHLERVLNEKFGQKLLIGGDLEDIYFYAIDRPKLSGLLPGTPFHFFSFFTLHWCVLWLAGMFAAVTYGWSLLSEGGWGTGYLTALLLWVTLNGVYLAWYFLKRRDLRKMDRLLAKELSSKTVLIPAALEQVFSFHLDPANLAVVQPPGAQVVDSDFPTQLELGATCSLTVKVPFGTQHWVITVDELVRTADGQKAWLVDRAEQSPFRNWSHRHEFTAASNGTLMRDEVLYQVVSGWFAPMVNAAAWVFLYALFSFRHYKTKAYFIKATGEIS